MNIAVVSEVERVMSYSGIMNINGGMMMNLNFVYHKNANLHNLRYNRNVWRG
tara:strand:+ start:336 stop:491 length:156 start_codon:yes stop_codon:yes gene_type:complete